MTIRDLIGWVEIQGKVRINKLTEDDVIPVYLDDYGLWETDKTEEFLDEEIVYMYASQ